MTELSGQYYDGKTSASQAVKLILLDTGIDIPEVVNLVFAKPVFSKVKFWQMIGRGTRRLDPEQIKDWCSEKDDFLIVDHWSNFEYFKLKPDGELRQPQDSLPTKLFKIRAYKLRHLMANTTSADYESIMTELKQSIQQLPTDSVTIMENKAAIDRVLSDAFWTNIDIDFLYKFRPFLAAQYAADVHACSFQIALIFIALHGLKESFFKDDFALISLG